LFPISNEVLLLHLFIAGSLRVFSPVSGVARFSAKPRQKVYRPEICITGENIRVDVGVTYVTRCSVLCWND